MNIQELIAWHKQEANGLNLVSARKHKATLAALRQLQSQGAAIRKLAENSRDARITREWAMPSPATFSIPPISALLDRWLAHAAVVVDPFCGDSVRGTVRNNLRNGGKEASVWLSTLSLTADAVLFDPPYSPRQISEVYKSVGLSVGMEGTQNGRLYKAVKDELDRLLRPGGIAICCGWNSCGFGITRGYTLLEILLVAHGGAHNDTIVTVERKEPRERQLALADGQETT